MKLLEIMESAGQSQIHEVGKDLKEQLNRKFREIAKEKLNSY